MKKEGYDDAAAALKGYADGGFGSGFVYVASDGNNYIVTNRHVVSEAATINLEFDKGDGSQVSYKNCPIIAISEDIDLALVGFPDGAKPFKEGLSFVDGDRDDGEEVWSAGYPGLGDTPSWQLGKGNITNAKAKISELADPAVTTLIQHSAQIDPGNSGGPLLIADKKASAKYAVIGINTWKARDRQAANFSIPAAAIEKFISASLDKTAARLSPAQALEGRCRDLVGTMLKDEAYKSLARYISYSYVAKDGKVILEDVLETAPTAARDYIAAVFVGVSPIEGIRLAIAYKIQKALESPKDKDGKSSHLPFTFAAIDGNPDSDAAPVPVRFNVDSKEITLTWTREYGLWRLDSWPFKDVQEAKDKAAAQKGTKKKENSAVSAVTFDDSPYSALFHAGAIFSLSKGEGMLYEAEIDILPSPYVVFGASVDFRRDSYTDSYSHTTTKYTHLEVGPVFGFQLPIQTAFMSIIPFAHVKGELCENTGYGSFELQALARAGLILGLGSEDFKIYIGTDFRKYLLSSNLVAGPAIGVWIGLGM